MKKEIVRDTMFLRRKAKETTKEDLGSVKDLLDTYLANADKCAGMAANMIGVQKRFIVFDCNGLPMIMLNPHIVSKEGRYESTEGCLSISGIRKTVRYQIIRVAWQDTDFKKHTETFTGLTAQIIQHEVDHCDGILV